MTKLALHLLLFLPLLLGSRSDNRASNPSFLTSAKPEQKETAALHCVIKGSGSPTVIFESGLGTPLYNWNQVQTALSEHYQTLSYDRRGIGQSPSTDLPRTLENLVNDLDLLIKQNKIEGPIVLVGHSLGGYIVRKYQEQFPAQVVGLFLIDPSIEKLYEEVFKQMSPQAADSMRTAWDANFKNQAMGVYQEWQEVYTIEQQMRSCPLPADIPVTILASYKENAFLTKKNAQIKAELFADWKGDKTNVEILNTTNSGHYIHLAEPDWVITELEAFLKNLK